MYKPYHLIGLELGFRLPSIMVRGEPTGATRQYRGDVVATAKRDLKPGERLDGEGGFIAYGKLMSAQASLAAGGLPIGLAHNLLLKQPVASGRPSAGPTSISTRRTRRSASDARWNRCFAPRAIRQL